MGRTEDLIERAFSKEEREQLLKNNKYWHVGDNEFDPIDILIEGNYPKLESRGDKFRCVMAVATFIKERDSISGISEGLANYLRTLEHDLRIVLIKQLSLKVVGKIAQKQEFKGIVNDFMKIVK